VISEAIVLKRPMLKKLTTFLAGLAMAAAVPLIAPAAEYPTRPVTIVVAFTPGGPSDVLARIVGKRLQEILHQPFIVENRPGAGGNIAAEQVKNAPADGYTLLMGTNTTNAANPALFKKLSYDPEKDFVPIMRCVTGVNVLVVNNELPIKSIAELIDYAKKNPGKLNYAEASASQRLSAEMFNKLAGVKIERVPYKASPQALGDVISGQVQVMFPDLPQGLAQIDAGKVRGLGTTGPQRSTVAPNLPAIAETVPGYVLVYWLAVFAPAGTPQPIQKTLADAITEALKDPATAKAMTQGRMEISPLPLDQFAAYVKEQTAWWTKEIKAAGIEPE
jgi:tripartite-type tricarboxylate transporter receptor subunit TctC